MTQPPAMIALIFVAILGGCSSREVPIGPAASWGAHFTEIGSQPFGSTDAGSTPLLYVSDAMANYIEIYKQTGHNQSPIATLSGSSINGPEGLFVARNEDLYVANFWDSNVIVFKRGATTPYMTLLDPGEFPYDVVVDTTGTVYVTNFQTTTGGVGSVSVYAGGSTIPTSVLAAPNNQNVRWCTLNRNHNLFIDFQNTKTHTGEVMEFYKGVGPGHPTELKVGIPAGMQFDGTQDLVVANQTAPEALLVFEKPMKTPAQTIPTGGSNLTGIAFTKSGNDVFVAAFNSFGVFEFAYPSGTVEDFISQGLQNGYAMNVATDPPRPF